MLKMPNGWWVGFTEIEIVGSKKPEISVKGGYFNLDVTTGNMPPLSDCSTTEHMGRMVLDEVSEVLYLCAQSGWVVK